MRDSQVSNEKACFALLPGNDAVRNRKAASTVFGYGVIRAGLDPLIIHLQKIAGKKYRRTLESDLSSSHPCGSGQPEPAR